MLLGCDRSAWAMGLLALGDMRGTLPDPPAALPGPVRVLTGRRLPVADVATDPGCDRLALEYGPPARMAIGCCGG